MQGYQDIKDQIIEAKDDIDQQVANFDGKVASAQDVTSALNTAIRNANTAKSQLTTATTNANSAKTNLTNATNTANTAKSNLETATTNANNAKADAETAKTNLDASISSANTAKTNLETAIRNAGTAKINLDSSTETANTARSNLNTAIQNANTAKTNLEQVITNAGTAKTNLSNKIKEAEGILSNLNEANQTANENIIQLDAKNATAVQNINDLRSENFNAQEILVGVEDIKAYTDAWCATFVSACAIKAGVTDILPTECGCEPMVNLFKNLGEWVENDAYVPKAGDVIFYDWDDSGSGNDTGWTDHVGIVEACAGGKITVIEGNKNNAVERRILNVNGKYIRGFGVPKYTDNTVPSTLAKKSIDTIAKEVIQGLWGNGDDRKNRLTSAGYDYSAVQSKVNAMMKGQSTTTVPKKSVDELAREVINGKWGNGDARKKALTDAGYDYSAVQKKVNQLLAPSTNLKSIDTIAKEVIQGKWGNGQARVDKLTKAGYNAKAVQKRVNQMLS